MTEKPTPTKPRGRPKQSAIKLGTKETVRIATKRAIKSTIGSSIKSPIAKLVITAAIGAVAAYFINKA